MLCRNNYEYVNKLFHFHFHQLFSGWMVISIDDEMPPFALTFCFQRRRFQQGWWNYLKGAKRQFFYISVHAVVKTVQAEQWGDAGPTPILLSEHTICQAIAFWRCQRYSAEGLANRSDALPKVLSFWLLADVYSETLRPAFHNCSLGLRS